MNRKKSSLFFMPLLVIFSLIVLINLYDVLLSKNVPIIDNPIGKRQFDLLKTYLKAESVLFYIDQSAKYSLQQVVYELAKDGGLSEIYASDVLTSRETPFIPTAKKCSKFYGYSLWYEKDDGCFDENKVKLNLELLFNERLNSYLDDYPSNIWLNNYDYEIRGSIEIIGRAKKPLKLDILKDEKKEVVKKPIEEKIITKEGITESKDFTGIEFCARGSKCELTAEAYQKLEEAQKLAKEKGKSLEIYSAYRSEEEQIALWEGKTPEKYMQRFPNEEERRKYVCNPNLGLGECPHMTGKAVDVRFKGKSNSDMTVDDLKELEKIMYTAGFRRYAAELWHYECCGTDRYNRAVQLEKETGKEIRAIS